MSELDKLYLAFLPRNLREINQYGYYDPNRLAYTMAMALNPNIVESGLEDDYASGWGLGQRFSNGRTGKNNRAHFWPSILGLIPQIAYTPGKLKLETAREEIPHAVMMLTGRLPLYVIAQDFVLGGGHRGLKRAYTLPGTFENATHGESSTVKYNSNRYIKGLRTPHSSKGALYWIDLFNKGNIDELNLDKRLDKVYSDQLSNRNDKMFDTLWNYNDDKYATVLKKLGVTDGGDVHRITLIITDPIAHGAEIVSSIADMYHALGDKTNNKSTRIKSAKKRLLNGLKQEFDNINVTKDAKVLPAIISWNNVLQRPIVNANKKMIKKVISKVPQSVKKTVKDIVKPVAPVAKKITRGIWNSIPKGNVKDALRDNPILGLAASAARKLGIF